MPACACEDKGSNDWGVAKETDMPACACEDEGSNDWGVAKETGAVFPNT